jgi:hypothetical protein
MNENNGGRACQVSGCENTGLSRSDGSPNWNCQGVPASPTIFATASPKITKTPSPTLSHTFIPSSVFVQTSMLTPSRSESVTRALTASVVFEVSVDLHRSVSIELTKVIWNTGELVGSNDFPATQGFGQVGQSAFFLATKGPSETSSYDTTPNHGFFATSTFPISSQLGLTSEFTFSWQGQGPNANANTTSISLGLVYGLTSGFLVLFIGIAIFIFLLRRRRTDVTDDGWTEFPSCSISTEATIWVQSSTGYVSEENSVVPAAALTIDGVDVDETRYPAFFH